MIEDLVRPLPPSRAEQIKPSKRKPEWLKIRAPGGEGYLKIREMLRARKLHTVCEEAHCPNLSECWTGGTATLMLGGDICTRGCRFCAVKTSRTPPALDPLEPQKVAASLVDLELHYVVLTSVDRDDLADGGAGHFAATIRAIKQARPDIVLEALVPDFKGASKDVETVVHSGVDVYAHNVETVPRLQYRVRDPRAGFEQSIQTLVHAKRFGQAVGKRIFTKSSLMLGLGETESEILKTMDALLIAGVDVLTMGQYLRPSLKHLPVERYVHPDEFDHLAELGRAKGFIYVASGPLVRSSYRAAEFFLAGLMQKERSISNGIQTS